MSPTLVAPVDTQERISSLDLLRGVAVLGILLMNIAAFGLPEDAYLSPAIAGGAEGLNLGFWFVNQILFEGKMRCIFSMLFGAGSFLLLQRAEERGAGLFAADIYCRRLLWLILFGLIHAYLIWYGDILFYYGVVGLTLLPFRRMSPKGLLIFGGAIFLLLSLQMVGASFAFAEMRDKANAATALEKAGKTLSDEQKGTQKEWAKLLEDNRPDAKALKKEVDTHRGGYGANLGLRARQAVAAHTEAFYHFIGFDVFGAMLIGMALFKLGVLGAEKGIGFYTRLLVIGYGIGLPFNAVTGYLWMQSNWDLIAMFRYIFSGLSIGRLSVALGHVGLLMIIYKRGWLLFLTRRLAAVGQMALSNYLMHSIVCTLLFNGYGFGLFDKLQRFELLYVVLGIWIVQTIVSPIWLRHFRYGPFEWLWRSLTYWKKQPMRRVNEGTSPSAEVSEDVCSPLSPQNESPGVSQLP